MSDPQRGNTLDMDGMHMVRQSTTPASIKNALRLHGVTVSSSTELAFSIRPSSRKICNSSFFVRYRLKSLMKIFRSQRNSATIAGIRLMALPRESCSSQRFSESVNRNRCNKSSNSWKLSPVSSCRGMSRYAFSTSTSSSLSCGANMTLSFSTRSSCLLVSRPVAAPPAASKSRRHSVHRHVRTSSRARTSRATNSWKLTAPGTAALCSATWSCTQRRSSGEVGRTPSSESSRGASSVLIEPLPSKSKYPKSL
mmetsp:Transcript_10777/g.30160  ORF Transcript_10777/g.30160 Transcript_10777/m.30160 type:complete len:253 (-) Transcript_10777:295-1053(-)